MAKQRGNNEGSIYQRKDGRWTAAIPSGRDKSGKMRREYLYGKTRKEVAAKLTAVLNDRNRGIVLEPTKQTLGQFLDSWLKDVKKGSVRPTTYESYEGVLRHAAPIRDMPLTKITAQRVQRLCSDLREKGLGRTVELLHAILHQAFDQAIKWNLVPRNIMEGVSVLKAEKKEIRPLTQEEAGRLLRAAEDDRLHALYVLAVSCGLRFGEALGLRWQDINLEEQTVAISHQLSKTNRDFVPLKTQRSRRTVRLPQMTLKALKKHRQRQLEERMKVGDIWHDYDLVFTTEIGTPLSQSNVRNRSFYGVLEKAGLPRIRFHDLRHTCATLLLSQGVHPRIVQEQLGHSRSGTTLDTYSHVTPPMMSEVAAKMDSILADKKQA